MNLNKKRIEQQETICFDINKSLKGINNIALRLNAHGGFPQEDRMIQDKRKSFNKSCLFSYQGAFIQKIDFDLFEKNNKNEQVRALINPNKLKQDYDDKIVSVGFEHNFHTGDIFNWCNTNTKWLIYLQDLTELAYFKGDIRRCNYTLEWEDETGHHKTYCAVRGPVETKINYIQKHSISVDVPNHSINIMMPSNEYTLKYFKRYTKFYLQDNTDEHKICWRVEALDWISMPGILEVNGVEYYANEYEDDTEKGLVGVNIQKIEDPNTEDNNLISGDTFIKPKINYVYIFLGDDNEDKWYISSDVKLPIIMNVDPDDPCLVNLQWTKAYSGQFVLNYGEYSKTIVVESLF